MQVLGRGTRSENKRQSPPASPSRSSTNVPINAFRGEWRQRRVFVLKIKSHTHRSIITNCCWAIWNILTLTGKELDLVEKVKQYHLNIVRVSLIKKRGSATVDLGGKWKLFYFGADPNVFAQTGVGILTRSQLPDCLSD